MESIFIHSSLIESYSEHFGITDLEILVQIILNTGQFGDLILSTMNLILLGRNYHE